MHVKNKATGEAFFAGQFDMLGAVLEKLNLELPEAEITFDSHEAAQYAGIFIERFYPMYKQINILRGDSKEERERMNRFIDACREWANQENPMLNELSRNTP